MNARNNYGPREDEAQIVAALLSLQGLKGLKRRLGEWQSHTHASLDDDDSSYSDPRRLMSRLD
jgi:hypothetical protein